MLMVYSTIRNIKGKIKVKSKVGKGTTFLLYDTGLTILINNA